MRRDIWFLINDFTDFNYMAPLIIYGKDKGIKFKVVIVFEHFLKKNKKEFLNKKDEVLGQPIFKGVDVESLSISDFRGKFKSLKGIIVSTSGTITRLKGSIYNNRRCRYVAFSYFNDKVESILDNVDLVFISSAKDLEKVSGLNVRIGMPYWDLYDKNLPQYDFQHFCSFKMPENTYNILIPEIHAYKNWHEDARKWIVKNYKDDCFYIFKHRVKDEARKKKNLEFKKSLSNYSNICHIHDPYFFTTQKLLKNCDEVLFLSNRTLFVYECAKAGIKCRRAYDEVLNFMHFDPLLIDKYIKDAEAVRREIFAPVKHATENCFNEIKKLMDMPQRQSPNKPENLKVIKFENIDFSLLDFIKGKPRNRQLFFSLDGKMVYKTWVKDWQWADCLEEGIKANYYDIKLIPNLYALIKDNKGENRGYVMVRVSDDQLLSNFENVFSVRSWIKWLKGETTLKRMFLPKYKKNQMALSKLVYEVLARALRTKRVFVDFCVANLWADKNNYYLFDLENCVGFDWFFNKNSEHPEHVRQAIHRHIFNRGMEKLFKMHNLIFPMRIDKEEDIAIFWEKFVKINNLTNIPKTLNQ